jgi:hypothetical protein
VLEGVLETLSQLCQEQLEADLSVSSTTEPSSNLFDALHFEETEHSLPSLELTECSKSRRSPPPLTKDPVYFARTPESDLPFAIICFHNDLNDILKFLSETWKEYQRGAIELMSASVTTDIAIEMVKQKEHGFWDNVNVPKDFTMDYLGKHLFDFCVAQRRKTRKSNASLACAADKFLFNLAQFVYLPNYLHLKKVCNLVKDVEVDTDLTNLFLCTPVEKHDFNETGEVLDSVTFEMHVLHLSRRANVAEDPFAVGILDLMKQNFKASSDPKKKLNAKKNLDIKNIPTWLCFAAQTYLDVDQILTEKDKRRAFNELKNAGSRALEIISRHLRFHKGKVNSSWPKEMDNSLRTLQQLVNTSIVEQYMDSGVDETMDRHQMLYRHPIWNGLVMFQISKTLQQLGMHCANAWNTVIPQMHLYNAARQEHQVSEWVDMEYLINYHDPNYLFVGSRPTDTEAYHNKFLIAMGTGVEQFTSDPNCKDKRKATSHGLPKGARYLRQNIIASHTLSWR